VDQADAPQGRPGPAATAANNASPSITPTASPEPEEDGIAWGEKVRGIQLGARIAPERSVFQGGDTVIFRAFGRNLSGEDVSLSIGRYWKVNYDIQVQTLDGKPVDVKREVFHPLPAGYMADLLRNGATQEISGAKLKIARRPQTQETARVNENEDAWVKTVPMEPGRYRIRLLSRGLFGARKPVSGWIPIDVRKDARKGQAEEVTSEVTSQVKLVRDEQPARADVDTAQQELARVSALYKDGLAPDDDVVEAQIEVAEARLRLSAAQQQPHALMLPDLETLVTLRERRVARATELYKAGLIRPEDVSAARWRRSASVWN
jgi:hypothetical protein